MWGVDWGEWTKDWVVVSSRTGGGRRGKGGVVVAVYMREEGSGDILLTIAIVTMSPSHK